MKKLGLAVCMSVTTLLFETAVLGQYQPGERVYTPPRFGTFWTLQTGWSNTAWAAPLPFFPFDPADVPLYALTNDSFFFEFDWAGYSDLFGGPMDDSSIYGDDPYGPPFGTNDFWVEIVAATNGFCLVAAHNVRPTNYCQLQVRAALDQPVWVLGEVVLNDPLQTGSSSPLSP